MRVSAMLAAVVGLLSTSACAGHMSGALAAYDEGRYPDAIQELRAAEPDASAGTVRERARYQLYRGLTHLALGDARQADVYLSRAKAAWERDPRVFDDRERGRLLSGWRSMGHMPGESGRVLSAAAE